MKPPNEQNNPESTDTQKTTRPDLHKIGFEGNTFESMVEGLSHAYGKFHAEPGMDEKAFSWSLDVASSKVGTVLNGFSSDKFSFDAMAAESTFQCLTLCLPLSGGMAVRSGTRTHSADQRGLLLYSSLEINSVSLLGKNNRIGNVILPLESIEAKMNASGHDAAIPKTEFVSSLDKGSQGYELIRGLSQVLVDGAKQGGPLLHSTLAFTGLIEGLTDVLATELCRQSSSRFTESEIAAAPPYVKRAVDYMHANAHKPISITMIAASLNISTRSLELGFKSFLQQSPLAYLQRIRLEAARTELLNPEAREPIKCVCLKWGFYNFGRFAALYKKAYGELPSDTVTRVRG